MLVVDPAGRLLLFQDSDTGTGALFWILPGGGIDSGESDLDAVIRELQEETGHLVEAGAVLGPIARQHVVHGYSDKIVDQHDTYYAVHTPAFGVSTAGHTEEELRTMLGHRWWTRDELAATADVVWPGGVVQVWQLLDTPQRWPVEFEGVEESSVAVEPGDRRSPQA